MTEYSQEDQELFDSVQPSSVVNSAEGQPVSESSVDSPGDEEDTAPTEPDISQDSWQGYLTSKPPIIQAIAAQESNNDPTAVSPTGVQGLMQVSGDTWRRFGGGPDQDRFDPYKSLDIGEKVYDAEYKRFGGNVDLALAAYNGGAPTVIRALKSAGYGLKDASSVSFDEIAPYIDFGNEAKNQEIRNYPGLVHSKLKDTESSFVDRTYTAGILSEKDIGSEDELKASINNLAADPSFDFLPAQDKINKLKSIYNTKKRWTDDATALFKDASSIIWSNAKDSERPDFAGMLGTPSQLPVTSKAPKDDLAKWQQLKIRDLANTGNNPLFYGGLLDNYLASAADNELEALTYRQRSTLNEAAHQIGSAVTSAGRGFIGGTVGALAAVPRLGGFEDTANAIESVSNFLPEPSRSFVFSVDDNGYVNRDAYGKPLTNFRAGIAQGVGQVASLFAGTGALKKIGTGANWIKGYVLGTNALQTANDAYKDAVENGGTDNEGRLAALYSMPSAAVDSLGDLITFGTGKAYVNSLRNWNKVKALSLNIGKGVVVEGGTEAAQQYMQDVGTSTAIGKNIIDTRKILEAGVAGAVVGGLVGGLTTEYEHAPLPPSQKALPAPPTRLGLPAPQSNTIYVKPEVSTPVGQLGLPAPQARLGLPGVEIPLGLPPGVKREALPGKEPSKLISSRYNYSPETTAAIELYQIATPEEHSEIAAQLDRFQTYHGDSFTLTPDQASKITPEMLQVFQYNLSPDENGNVQVTRKHRWEYQDAEDLNGVNDLIHRLQSHLESRPGPEGTPQLVLTRQELKQLKQEEARLRDMSESQATSVGKAYAQAFKVREAIVSRLNQAKDLVQQYRKNDPAFTKLARLEVENITQELQAHDTANKGVYAAPNAKIGRIQVDLENVQTLIKAALDPLHVNTIAAVQDNLNRLLRKKADLESRQQSFTTEDSKITRGSKQADAAAARIAQSKKDALRTLGLDEDAQIDPTLGIPVGSNFVIPANNKWYTVNSDGNILGKNGHAFVFDAVREAKGLSESSPVYSPQSTQFTYRAADDRTKLTEADEKRITAEVAREREERKRVEKLITNTKAEAEKLYRAESEEGVKAKERVNKLIAQKEASQRKEQFLKAQREVSEKGKAAKKAQELRDKEYQAEVKKNKKLWLEERRKAAKAQKTVKKITSARPATPLADTVGMQTVNSPSTPQTTRRRLSAPRKPITPDFTPEIVFAEDGTTEVKPQALFKDAKKIITKLDKYIRIFQGGRMPKRVLGYLNFVKNDIKVGAFNDVMTMLHEITHSIDKSVIGKWDVKGAGDYSKVPTKVLEDLKDTADTFYPVPLTSDMTRIQEGFAMFFQHYLTGQPVKKSVLDWYNGDFKNELPELYESLEELKTNVFDHYNQTPETFVRSMVVPKQNTFLTGVKNYWTVTNLLDKWANRAQIFGETDSLSNGQYRFKDFYDAGYRRARELTGTFISTGPVDADGNRVGGMSIKEALSLAEGKFPELEAYLVARRGMAYLDAGLNPGINRTDLEKTIRNTEQSHPEVVQAAHNYYDAMDHALATISTMSRESKAFVDRIRKDNLTNTGTTHGFYLPFSREGKTSKFKAFKTRTGSTRSITDPIANIQDALETMFTKAFHSQMKEIIADASAGSDASNIGLYIREVTGTQQKVLLDTYLAKARADLGADLTKKDSIFYAYVASPLDGVSSDQFKVLTYMDGDKLRFFEVNPRIVEALADELPDVVNSFWFKYLYRPGAQLLRPLATSFRAAFQIKQLIRDPLTAYRYVKTGEGDFKDFLSLYKTLASSILDTSLYQTGRNKNGWTALASRLGVLNATRAGALQDIRTSMESKFGKNLLDLGSSTLDKIENVLSTPEVSTRIAAMRLELRRLGVTDPNQTLSTAQALEAILAFKRSTTNFQIQGSSARVVNLGTPFFTARIAELTRLPGDFKRNPKRMMAYGAAMLTYGLYHALAHNGEDWYQELEPEAKMAASWYKVNIDGVDKLLYVPLDNWSSLTYGLGQAIGAKMGEDPNLPVEYTDLAKAYFGGHAPITRPFEVGGYFELLGPWGKEVLQQWKNYDLYFKKSIVPPNLEYQDPKLQYNEYTSELAKTIGGLINESPLRIDHAIRSAAPAASDYLQMGEALAGLKEGKEFQGYNVVVKALTKSGTPSGTMDRSQRIFTEQLLKFRESKVSEAPEEAQIRKSLEKINRDVSNINTFVYGTDDLELQDKARQTKRDLLRQGIRIAQGAKEFPKPSGLQGQAQQIRKKQALKQKEDLQRKKGVFSNAPLIGDTSEKE